MENTRKFKKNGMAMLISNIVFEVLCTVAIIFTSIGLASGDNNLLFGTLLVIEITLFIISLILYGGFKIVKPNEALVLTLFGNFYGVIQKEGFFLVNPFVQAVYPKDDTNKNKVSLDLTGVSYNSGGSSNKVSLKAMTLNNSKQKVNDSNGNPIEIGVVVIWKVIDPIKAVFDVDDYRQFVSIQSDSSIRYVARSYAYDGDDGEKTLTGSIKEISDKLQEIIQGAVVKGGIEIIDAKISHLAYSPEIASAMLQRQQADAIIAARQKIVEGAVGMVEQALIQLSEKEVVELDDERKAQMVSNLLVVLCANKEAQPVVNSGTIY